MPRPTTPLWSHPIKALAAAIPTTVILAATLLVSPMAAAADPPQTIVSLTFDDGRATAYNARSILSAHSMTATFYVNSAKLDSSSFYLSRQQVRDLYADGNEIAGHSVYHADLTTLDSDEQQREICYDRNTLLSMGFAVTNFAYPFGRYNSSAKAAASACGYNSARSVNVVTGAAEIVPPADPYAIKIGTGSLSVSALEAAVSTAVSHGGGWVPLMFHDICSGCSSIAISAAEFTELLNWLSGQASNGVIVKTVADVIGGPAQPPVTGPPFPAATGGVSTVRNAFVEYSSDGNAPDCFVQDGYGTNNAFWTITSDAHSGARAQRLEVTDYVSGDNKLMIQEDLGACTPSVLPTHRYRLTTWYKATAPVSFVVDKRGADHAFAYWTSSPDLPATSTWAQVSWLTPVIPGDGTGLSFGLALTSNGCLTVDDIGFVDADSSATDTTAPSTSLTAPDDGAVVVGTVTLAASATDDVALDHLDFLIDGTVAGTWVTGPTSYAWNSRSVTNGSHPLSARAVDTSGNSTTTATRSLLVSNQNVNLLTNPSLEDVTDSVPICWSLGGYGTNTYTWTRSTDSHSGTYAEGLEISSWTTGDRKLVSAQDSGSCAPTTAPGHTYTVSAWYKGTLPSYFYVYYRSSSGTWTYLGQSARVSPSSTWTQGSWSTPAIPVGATHMSIGLGGSGTGWITMDDFVLLDDAPAPTTPPPGPLSQSARGSTPTAR